jgi:hypothetical protein
MEEYKMSIEDTQLEVILEELTPVLLPSQPEYPPADLVHDTERRYK